MLQPPATLRDSISKWEKELWVQPWTGLAKDGWVFWRGWALSQEAATFKIINTFFILMVLATFDKRPSPFSHHPLPPEFAYGWQQAAKHHVCSVTESETWTIRLHIVSDYVAGP